MKLREVTEATYDNDKGGKFWGNAGAGVFIICPSTGKILIGKRGPEVNEPGTWSAFGGAMDDGEDPKKAAKREVGEELGHVGQVKLIPAYVFKSPDKTFTYYNFIGIVDKEFKPKSLDWETDKVEWVTYEDMLKKKMHFGLKALLKNDGNKIKKLLGAKK